MRWIQLPGILREFSAAIADPSPESDERMKGLLKKYVKYYQVPDAVIGKPSATDGGVPPAMRIAHFDKAEKSDLLDDATGTED